MLLYHYHAWQSWSFQGKTAGNSFLTEFMVSAVLAVLCAHAEQACVTCTVMMHVDLQAEPNDLGCGPFSCMCGACKCRLLPGKHGVFHDQIVKGLSSHC